MEEENNSKKWVIIIILTGIVATVLGLYIFNSYQKMAARTTAENLINNEKDASLQLKTRSGFRLKILNNGPIYPGTEINIGVYANSGNSDAVGFDLSIVYSNFIDYVGSKNNLEGYDVIETIEPDSKVIITGAKQLINSKKVVWKDQEIMVLTFKSQKSGIAKVGFELSPGSVADTNLFDQQNKDLVAVAVGSTIEIK